MQMYVWEPLVRGLQANTGWKEVKEGTWKEYARKWNELKETWAELKEH